MTMSVRTTRCGSLTPLSTGWISRRRSGRVQPKVTGRPAYAPADLLKLYIYGYLNRVRSSRRLEAETHRNIEVIWLLRHLKPDLSRPSPTFGATIAMLSAVSSVSLCCSVVNWICLAGSCWRWTAHGSRRSITRMATARASLTQFIETLMPSSMTIFSASTRATPGAGRSG